MSKFEERGSNIQYSCSTLDECKCEFDISCYSCTHKSRSLWCNCDSCHIKQAHNYMIEKLAREEVCAV